MTGNADRREEIKKARLAAALRDNLKRRKAQARANSAAGTADQAGEGLGGPVDRPPGDREIED